MKNPTTILLFVLLVILAIVFPWPPEKRVLFIGNSYTHLSEQAIIELFDASDHSRFQLEFVAPGGTTLEMHLEYEKTLETLASEEWDFVVIQEQSQTPAIYPDVFRQRVTKLNELVAKTGAKTVLFQTWGHLSGDRLNPERFPTYESMQSAISKTYATVAEEQNAILAPVGDAWSKVRAADEDKVKDLYWKDGHHQSDKGAFIVACVFYAVLTGDDPREVPYRGDLSDEDAEMIRNIALEVVTSR